MSTPGPPAAPVAGLPGAEITATAALSYARRGWPVFPAHGISPDGCCTCGSQSCDRPGKHPLPQLAPHGVKQATANEAIVRNWWTRRPSANLAIATGGPSCTLVLDIDPAHGGDETLADLEARHEPLPLTPRVITGSGGSHYYFRLPAVPTKNLVGFRPGLDIRTTGGYVIAPPSIHASGQRYEWDAGAHPDDVPLADVPDWLLELITAEPRGVASPSSPAAVLPDRIPDGQRNNMLFSLAGSMRRRGASESAILAALRAENDERCDPPLGEDELRKLARGIGRYTAAQAAPYRWAPGGASPSDMAPERIGAELGLPTPIARFIVLD